jgi:hypothetical protein
VHRLPENENVYKDVGINGKSPLLSLADESVHFILGVPYASVHVVSVAICKIVQRLWWGVYVFDQKPDYLGPTDSWNPPPYVVGKYWVAMGQELQDAATRLPAALGDSPHNIHTQQSGYTVSTTSDNQAESV